MAQDPVPKHLTITLDFDLQTAGSTVGEARVRAAYNAVVEAALVAAMEALPEGSIKNVTAEMDWSYRWMEKREVRFSRDDDGVTEQG
ncbi:hypothetical protein PV733_27985 [Streptomyces europaeiscabiei]|uniref:hypothetical protein n=1 Tax=Streptomyces europaeiscabiei TaxID=146819 RepID=UPI0029A61572|nr:hypothetical protein [Streptomyces europaeiscabiei]MDX3712710.1 hypothetical protein [Streptomyces europaeiscabiei]